MAVIRWTLQAAGDLEGIVDCIAVDSVHYAQLFAIDVLALADTLADFALRGKIVPEIGDAEVRELLCGNYRLIYRVRNGLVEILTIIHSARLLDPSTLG